MTRTIIAAALAAGLASPTFAESEAFWNSFNAAQMGYLQGSGAFDPPEPRVGCGQMGVGSNGICRMGLFGAIDQQAHGVCIVDRRTLATRCQR